MSQPVTPRRATRSSASAPHSPSSPPKSRPKPSPRRQLLAPAAAAAAEPKEESPLDALLDALPRRRAQATDLLRLLAPVPALPVLLHGGAATGKTRALLLALRHLGSSRRLAYAALRSLPSPRALFASLLSQLNPPSSSNSSRQRIPDKPSDFVAALHGALPGIVAQGEAVYLVFDNLEVVRSWDKGGQLIALLLRLHDLLRLPQVVLVYVSSATPDACYTMTGSVEPNYVYFPDYTVDEARDILMRGHPNPKLYSSFLSVVLKPLFRVTRRVDELAAVLEPLFRRYCEPLGDLNAVPDEGIKRRDLVALDGRRHRRLVRDEERRRRVEPEHLLHHRPCLGLGLQLRVLLHSQGAPSAASRSSGQRVRRISELRAEPA